MAIFFKAEERIREMIGEYLDTVDECIGSFQKAIEAALDADDLPDWKKTHAMESKADDIRREIALLLFGRALLPESRGDLLNLLESFDKVPNAAEHVLTAIATQRVRIPKEFKDDFRKLVENNVEACRFLRKTADALFNAPEQTLYLLKEVDIRESASDRTERTIIGNIFDSDMEKADKILLRSIVFQIGSIADFAEKAADRLGLVAIKRRI